LLQHGIDQRGLPVIDVRDDGDVANADRQALGSPLQMDRICGMRSCRMPTYQLYYGRGFFIRLDRRN
jgi:hypothetical protein